MASGTEQLLVRAREFALDYARRCGAGGYAEDVAQDALLRLLRQDPQPQNVEAWLTRVVANLLNDKHRLMRRRPRAVGIDGVDEMDELGQAQPRLSSEVADRMRIADALDSLSLRQREMLEAHLEGARNADIAERFGLANERVAAVTLARIRRRVREHLAAPSG
jgi:RNA polymerase sigma-70 factor (ECF subfamily)